MWPFRKPELHVLLVCTANICRSPAAEVLLRAYLKELGVGRRIALRSAGTEVEAGGMPPDPRMVAIAGERGIRLRHKRSMTLEEALQPRTDQIWVMEGTHLRAVLRGFPEFADRTELLDPNGDDIPDPYFGDKAGVRRVYERIDDLCRLRALELRERL